MSSVEITTKAREYREIQSFIKELEEQADALKAAIIAEMEVRGADTLQADVFTVKYTQYQTSRLDTTTLK